MAQPVAADDDGEADDETARTISAGIHMLMVIKHGHKWLFFP